MTAKCKGYVEFLFSAGLVLFLVGSVTVGLAQANASKAEAIPATAAPTWQTETVDSVGDVGAYTSLALDDGDDAHISYMDIGNFDLKYARQAGSTWQTETVDSSGSVGAYTSLDLDSGGRPHVSYLALPSVKYARYDGSIWYFEAIPGGNPYLAYTSLELDATGAAHVCWHRGTPPTHMGGSLEYGKRVGDGWLTDVLDSDAVAGQYPSLTLDTLGRPSISYYGDRNLKYASFDGSSWGIETVDATEHAGIHTSLTLDSSNRPRISYQDYSSRDLMYAVYNGTSWQTEKVDAAGDVGAYTSLALDSSDRPHISYYNESNGDLKYAYHDGSTWQIRTVDSAGDVGKYSSLALDSADRAHISYYNETNGSLKHAWQEDACPVPLTRVTIAGPATAATGLAITLNVTIEPTGATEPIAYAWSPVPADGQGTAKVGYEWSENGSYTVQVTVSNCGGSVLASHRVIVNARSLADVPSRFHRDAVEHLEDVRGGPLAPGWGLARLSSAVHPLYRPDVEGVAYYEFPVEVPSGTPGSAPTFEPAGFIIVTTDEHDFPIPHWDFAGEAPSRKMERRASEGGGAAARFYKLDALAYAAEDGDGVLVASLGTQPPKVIGLDPAWAVGPPETVETLWISDEELDSDTGQPQIGGTLIITGSIVPPSGLELGAWNSWEELKAGYENTYAVLLAAQRNQASEEWEARSAAEEYGGELRKGDIRSLQLLYSEPEVSTSGQGAPLVQTEIVSRPDLPAQLELRVLDAVRGQELPLILNLDYGNGVEETFDYVIIDPYILLLPIVSRDYDGDSLTLAASQMAGGPRVQGWTDWSYSWAGGDSDQCWYDQMDPYDSPNTKKCFSGCGATAWAMLFGWADVQCDIGNSYWAGRWGLYRVNGGTGADAVAPHEMDAGVKNMIWEIRGNIDTFCIWDCINQCWNGATWPRDMDGARNYLDGRSATKLYTKYNHASIPWHTYREKAWDSIKYRGTPAVIGIGFFAHYPLAYGYAQRKYRTPGVTWWTQRRFYVNQGWGSSGDKGWIVASIWFVGTIEPNSAFRTNRVDDVGVYRPSDHKWYYDYDHDGDTNETRGPWAVRNGDLPLAGDFDRDGFIDDVAVFRTHDSTWHYDYDHDGDTDEQRGPWGYSTDLPIVGDFDRDRFVDDVAVYRPSTHMWYYDYDHDGDTDETSGPWGWAEDRPFAGDFDRDGFLDDVAVFRPSTKEGYYDHAHDGDTDETVDHWGDPTGLPFAGDFDHDGFIDDFGLFIPPATFWLYDYDHNGIPSELWEWGQEGDLPIAGAFGGDVDPS